jgi:CubicO group peptidase (beta-lactamase class C family)
MINWPFARRLVFLFLLSPAEAIALAQSPAPAAPGLLAGVSILDGVWRGVLAGWPESLRIQLRLRSDAAGNAKCFLDSLDQNGTGIPCEKLTVDGKAVSFEVSAVTGSWRGTLSADGKTLTGTWTQGESQPLVFERVSKALKVKEPKEPRIGSDKAMPRVDVADLKPVLDRDLAEALKSGALSQGSNAGVTIGVVQHGVERIFSYGTAKPDSIFEIGSISKTFTGLILAQMVEQGKVRLDEPVRELLPPGVVAKPAAGREITLIDLSTHHSGLPRMPDNFHPADAKNPYADYDEKKLYEFISKHGVALPKKPKFVYSNVGMGLLGQALADRAQVPYATLLHDEVTGPLNLHDTAIALTPELQARFIEGHNANGKTVSAWDLGAMAGAGGIRSTAANMLTYLGAQLHPDRLPAGTLATPEGKTLASAIAMSHQKYAEDIAINWMFDGSEYEHSGGTGGYTSQAIFDTKKDYAVIVLLNVENGDQSDFATDLGIHITQRLDGKKAISLTKKGAKMVDLDAKVLDSYVGSYELTPGVLVTVTREGNLLMTQATGDDSKVAIFPESATKFFFKNADVKVTFVTDAQGRATGMVVHQDGMDHEAKRLK